MLSIDGCEAVSSPKTMGYGTNKSLSARVTQSTLFKTLFVL